MDKKAVGMRISEIRRNKGLTLEEFGKLVENAGKSTVSKWERGSTIPNNKRLKVISEIGGLSIDRLLYGSMRSFIINNFHQLIPYREGFPLGIVDLRKLEELAEELDKKEVQVSDIEKIKSVISEKIPQWKKGFQEIKDKELNFIANNKSYKNQVYNHFEASTSWDLEFIEKVFNEAENFSFDEMVNYSSKIEEIYVVLDSILNNSANFTDAFATLLDEEYFIKNVDCLELSDKTKEYIYYKLRNMPFPRKENHHEILIHIKKSGRCSLIKKGTLLLLHYFPDFQQEFLNEYLKETQITLVIAGDIFLGFLDSDFNFNSFKNNEPFHIDLKSNPNKYYVFPTAAVFY